MAKQGSIRAGGKYTGSHTTVIPAAATVCDIVNGCPHVTKISLGFITANLTSLRGKKRVKMSPYENGSMLLRVRDNTAIQEVRVFSENIHKTMDWIESNLHKKGTIVSSRSPADATD